MTSQTITQAKKQAVLDIIADFYVVIVEAGAYGVPSGHLYAHVMGAISLETYTKIINMLKAAGLVEEQYHVLYALTK